MPALNWLNSWIIDFIEFQVLGLSISLRIVYLTQFSLKETITCVPLTLQWKVERDPSAVHPHIGCLEHDLKWLLESTLVSKHNEEMEIWNELVNDFIKQIVKT